MKKVSIVILDYKNKSDTVDCIASMEKLVHAHLAVSIIVVNNDTSYQYAKDMFPSLFPITVLNNDSNTGYAGGNNAGIKVALSQGAEYIMLLNNDTIIHSLLLVELMHVLESQNDCGLVSPKIYFAKNHEFHKERYTKEELGKVIWYAGGIMDWKNIHGKHAGVDEVDHGQYDGMGKTDFATGCCMLFSASTIKNLGIFDERYFLYYEDSDLNERAKKKGLSAYYAPKAMLWHKNAGSTGGSGSTLQDYFITRNRMLFGMSYAPIRAKIALIKESIRLAMKGRIWQKVGIRDYYMGKFGKGSFGIQ